MDIRFASTLKNLPEKPGVYRFFGSDGTVLYIGKAKNLKNRVRSYFQEGRPKNQRLTIMISQINQIEYTVVATEKESLILEANLIYSLQPKYNVLLKDDKSYVYVRVTADPIPGIFLTRKKFDPRSTYFGPYTKRAAISDIVRTLRIIFPFCQEKTPQARSCGYVGIKQCDGICTGQESMEDYLAKIEQIKRVLSGKIDEVEQWLQEKIQQAASIGNFELAALWRNRLSMLSETIQDQKIILPQPEDIDLVTIVIDQDESGLDIASVFVQNIRAGKIINVSNFLLSGSEEGLENEEIESHFVRRFFSSIRHQEISETKTFLQVYRVNTDTENGDYLTKQKK